MENILNSIPTLNSTWISAIVILVATCLLYVAILIILFKLRSFTSPERQFDRRRARPMGRSWMFLCMFIFTKLGITTKTEKGYYLNLSFYERWGWLLWSYSIMLILLWLVMIISAVIRIYQI